MADWGGGTVSDVGIKSPENRWVNALLFHREHVGGCGRVPFRDFDARKRFAIQYGQTLGPNIVDVRNFGLKGIGWLAAQSVPSRLDDLKSALESIEWTIDTLDEGTYFEYEDIAVVWWRESKEWSIQSPISFGQTVDSTIVIGIRLIFDYIDEQWVRT